VTSSEDTETRARAADDVEEDASPLEQLEVLKSELATMLDGLQRSRAEFANYRRRIEQEQANMRVRATEGVLKNLLPVADDFDRAIRSVPDDIRSNTWFEGIRLVERKLWSVLENEGVRLMDAVGTPFDPSRHDAIMVDESASAADTVVEEFQRGYYQHDNVLRPAMVKVGAAATDEAAPDAVKTQA
jgi:molecular chaperone GrpE